MDKQRIADLGPSSWHSRHPSGAPYFLEFLPLTKPAGGIAQYHRSMAVERFIPASGLDGSIGLDEVAYIESLVRHARSLGKQPVLTDTRTLGRLSALKRQFGGIHIFLHRNLFHQWASYSQQAFEGNTYFLQMLKEIIKNNQHDPFIRDLHQLHPLGEIDYRSNAFFMAFLLLHLYLYCNALSHADIVVDVTKLASSTRYRTSIESTVYEKTGIVVDLSSVQSNFESAFVVPEDVNELRERIRAAIDLIETALRPKKKRIRQLGELVEELIGEIQRHKFYAEGIGRIVCREGGLLDTKTSLDAAISSANALSQQRDQLVVERDVMRMERDTLREERDNLIRQRDSLVTECNMICTERDGLRGEREELLRQLHNFAAERDSARVECDGLRLVREELTRQRDDAIAERDMILDERSKNSRQLLVASPTERSARGALWKRSMLKLMSTLQMRKSA